MTELVLDMEVVAALGLEAYPLFGLETFRSCNPWFSVGDSAVTTLLPHSAEFGIPARRAHILRPRTEITTWSLEPLHLAHFCKVLQLQQNLILESGIHPYSGCSVAWVLLDSNRLLLVGKWNNGHCTLEIQPEISSVPHERSLFISYA